MSLFRKYALMALPLLVILLSLAGYGWAGANEKVTCMLDWYPNPVHVPLYLTQSQGLFAAQDLEVDIQVPADPNDPLKLVAAGQVDFAVSYQPSVIMAAAEGLPVVSLGALTQHPLSCILFLQESGLKTPTDFKGRRIGYSVEPLYRVLLEAVAETAGLDPKDYQAIRVGFNLAPPLLTGQVEAVVGAFRNYEAIQVELEGRKIGIMALEDHGVPDFYELVIIANPDRLRKKPESAKKFMAALTAGIDLTLSKPKSSLETFLKLHPDLRDELNRRSFEATLPLFQGSPAQDHQRWQDLQDFMLKRGLIKQARPVKDLVWEEKD